MKYLIRFDDFCPTMDYEQWYRADAILRKYNIKPLIGVVPDCHDPELMIDDYHEDFWEYVKQLQSEGYAFAMHGDTHVYCNKKRGMVNNGINTEFAGLSYQQQLQKINHGKNELKRHGIETDIFFAPSHSYDRNTLKALAACGFKYVSDGKSLKPIMREGIICLPCRDGGVRSLLYSEYSTVVFHPSEWSRPDKSGGYNRLKNICEYHHNEILDFEKYSQQPIGNYLLQVLNEKLYLVWNRHIVAFARLLRNIFFK